MFESHGYNDRALARQCLTIKYCCRTKRKALSFASGDGGVNDVKNRYLTEVKLCFVSASPFCYFFFTVLYLVTDVQISVSSTD